MQHPTSPARKRSRPLVAAAVILLLTVAAYWYWSPYWAIYQLRAAADAGDVKALNARVDFPAVRENLKGQMLAKLAPKMGENSDNPFAALGTMFGMAMVNQMVDVFVRPEVIAQAVKTGKMKAAEEGNAPVAPAAPPPAAGASQPARSTSSFVELSIARGAGGLVQ